MLGENPSFDDTLGTMKWLLALALIVLASCSGDPQGLTVKQYHLRESMFRENNDLMARGEVQRLLHGAVTVEERLQKVGQYYHVIWNDASYRGQEVEVVFEYLQAASGSKVKTFRTHGISQKRFDAYFSVVGTDYQRNGRVLAWRVSFRHQGKEIASKKSYLWR